MKPRCAILAMLAFGCLFSSGGQASSPNILLIYADDLGYGDTSAYGATAVKTPNVDRLAREGLRFTSAYASSATCTPSRFSLLTGQYAFRKRGTGVLPGDAALILPTDRATLAKIVKSKGYSTAAVGKWHLGLGPAGQTLDWNQEIVPGPREVGFEYSFMMAATGDRVPCVYLENQKVVGLDPVDPIRVDYKQLFPGEPTGIAERDTLKLDWSHGHNNAVVNGIGRIGFMKGGKAALWKDEDMADLFTRKAVQFLERSASRQPFFLYFATHDIHVPRVPHPRFVGQTTMGPRGDVIVQFDWCVGQLLDSLDRLKLAENTLVILTSDNGPVLDDGYKDGAVAKLGTHKPAGPFRGGKYSLFEGGTRVPLIVRWPGRVSAGATSDALVSQVDFCASLAALVEAKLGPEDAPDSQNVLAALLGKTKVGRDHVVEHASGLALRQGNWKYIQPTQGPQVNANTKTEMGRDPAGQLYDLAADPGEKQNLITQLPERVATMAKQLAKIHREGAGGGGKE